ncbi:MAG: hypothetical protein FWD86_03960 [Firmicutes bacterium]|nr:hypothetical protein [Bacillota bacterium]
MENILFEGQMTYTKDFVKSTSKAVYLKILFLYISFPFIFVIVGVGDFLSDGNTNTLVLGALIVVVSLLLAPFGCKKLAKLSYSRICEQNNGHELTQVVQFFCGKILVKNDATQSNSSYSYLLIQKISGSKNYVTLTTKAGLTITVDKSRFSVGSPNELIEFIKQKIEENKKQAQRS